MNSLCKKDNAISEGEDFELFAEGYADALEDRRAGQPKRKMSGEMGVGYIFGWVGEIELNAAYTKWRAFGKPGVPAKQARRNFATA